MGTGRFPALEMLGSSTSATQKPLKLLGKSRLQGNLHLLLERDFPRGSWHSQMHLLQGAVGKELKFPAVFWLQRFRFSLILLLARASELS